MKVLHIITGLEEGGAEAVLYRLIVHDSKNIHEVVSLTSQGKYGSLLRNNGISVTALGMPSGQITLRGLRHLWQLIRSSKADVLQTWMYHANLIGGILGWLVKIPVVWGIRSTILSRPENKLTTIWIARLCAPLSWLVSSRIVICAESGIDTHVKMGYSRSRMVVIPNGYDLNYFSPDLVNREQVRNQWGISSSVPIIGMVARFDPQKDHMNLIEALAHLVEAGKNFQVVLVGKGINEDNQKLMGCIRKTNLANHVYLLGSHNDIPSIMNAIDLHVLSGSGEGFPNVLAEAMACGTPCVTTDVGDAALIVGNTGWVVPPRNPTALAQAIHSALEEWEKPEQWRRRQLACRSRIEQMFGIEKMVERYQQLWSEVVDLSGVAYPEVLNPVTELDISRDKRL